MQHENPFNCGTGSAEQREVVSASLTARRGENNPRPDEDGVAVEQGLREDDAGGDLPDENDDDDDDTTNAVVHVDEDAALEVFMRNQEEQEVNQEDVPDPVPRPDAAARRNPRPDARFEPQFEPLQPAFDGVDAQDDVAVSCFWITSSV